MASDRRLRENGSQLDIIERGNLEDISRPSSNRVMRSDRATNSATSSMGIGSASSVSRLRPQVARALELLTPEEVMEQEQEYDLDLADFSGSSDATSDDLEEITGRTSELFRIAEPLKEEMNSQSQELYQSDEDDKQIVLFGSLCGDDETMVDSDEEKAIMKDIRAEITAQIRGEMKSELEVYKKKREALSSACGADKDKKDDLEEDMDPELKQAIIKMRKLDRILDKKVKREKEVKRDRIILQRRLHEELVNLKPESGGRELKEVQMNTAKFLSLTLPPSHNSGITVDELPPGVSESPHPPVTPVFATQYEDDSQSTSRSSKTSRSDAPSQHSKRGKAKSSDQGTHRSDTSHGSESTKHDDAQSTLSGGTNSTNLTGSTRTRRKKRNFIKRNMELASDAANMIAMTEEEKNRVDNLLFNLDTLPEEDLEGGDGETNAFQIVPSLGEGYQPEQGEMRKLQDIDNKLRSLLPPEEFAMIAAPPTPRSINSSLSGGTLFTRTALDTETDAKLGEHMLQDAKEERDIHKRLRDIEGELNTLTSAVEHEMDCPKLSNEQLENLLDKCSSAMRRAQDETDHLAMSQKDALVVSRASMLENAPRLEENVLQELLADARAELRLTPSAQSTTPTPSYREGSADGESDIGVRIQELLANSRLRSRNTSRNEFAEPHSDIPDSRSELESNTEVPGQQEEVPEPKIKFLESANSSPPPSQYSSDDATVPSKSKDQQYVNSLQRKSPSVYNGGLYESGHSANDANDLHLVSYDEDMMQAAMEKNGLISKSGERQRFLPEIDPNGSLVGTPKHSRYSSVDDDSFSTGSNSARSSYSKMNNSLAHQGRQPSFDGDFKATPHPPDRGRPQGGSAGKHRSIVSRTNGDLGT